MKRRKALQFVAIGTASIALWPSCKMGGPKAVEGLGLDADQEALVDQFATAILPVEGLPVETPEKRIDFITTMLRDCTSPDERSQFKNGVNELQEYIQNTFQKPFDHLSDSDKEKAFSHLQDGDGISANLKILYSKTRSWSIQHFTTSSYFLNTYTDFQFVPGHFYGCVPV